MWPAVNKSPPLIIYFLCKLHAKVRTNKRKLENYKRVLLAVENILRGTRDLSFLHRNLPKIFLHFKHLTLTLTFKLLMLSSIL